MGRSLAARILSSKKPFTLFHTWTVTKGLLQQAIAEHKSMDLDVCVDERGHPYLGHSQEYHEKSGEPYFKTMAIWEAVEMIAESDIVAMVDVKHYDAWPIVEEVVARIGAERCLVCALVDEMKYAYGRQPDEPDFLTEWSPIQHLLSLKERHHGVTTTPCAKWSPVDLQSDLDPGMFYDLRQMLKAYRADTVCLGVPDDLVDDRLLRFFLNEGIIPHIMIDRADTSRLTEIYVGETDYLERVSVSCIPEVQTLTRERGDVAWQKPGS
ncbi:MAG: hypothetical protein AMXMBFR13_37720 [Phycisphaerae bacterium]